MIGGAKGIGLGIDLGLVNQYNRTGSQSYIEPEVLDSLVGVWSAYGMTNDSPNRSTIKNKLSNKGGDFVISNAAFKLNSGFGKYEVDFSTLGVGGKGLVYERLAESLIIINSLDTQTSGYSNIQSIKTALASFKIRIEGLKEGERVRYYYNKNTDDTVRTEIDYTSDGIYELPTSVAGNYSASTAFGYILLGNSKITITQIPSFEGAFVTDGVDDLITSTKTVQEMLGGSNEITVVSMAHQIGLGCRTNFICDKGSYWRCNEVANTGEGKTGIYGYSSTNISVNTPNIINNVLGDKVDYSVTGDRNDLTPSQFSVVGYISSSGKISYTSSVAWYWTIIANKVLTTDQINQVIAYFNLDRTLKPDILCDVKKQGITNDNHAEFGDKLIDFSGNGRDIQLNNIAWKGDSGIGKYEVDFLDSSIWNSSNSTITSSKIDCKNAISHIMLLYYSVGSKEYPDIPSFKVIKTGADIDYSYIDETGSPKSVKIVDGVNILPASHNTLYSGSGRFCGFGNPGMGNSVTITQIPSHAGGLCLDGINDFGKVTGMPVYKDYTLIADRYIENNVGSVASKSVDSNQYGAFIFEIGKNNFSFNTNSTGSTNLNKDRTISYLSKYSYNGENVNVGNEKDSDSLWLGTIRDNETRFSNIAIYSLMSFPYSMSEFLIERQLKKYKLGTLYPNMVEFRPVIKSNASYDNIVFYYKNEKVENGTYLTVGSSIGMHICLSSSPVNEIKSITVNGIPATFKYHDANNNIYQYDFNLTSKSPQNINIIIDEYIRYEDIVQPYPVLLRFNDENGNEVSWGGKFRVGSTITRIGSAADSNLLPNIYNIFGLLLNDNQVTSSKVIVEKTMVFKAKSAYIFDNNEPKVILSPSRLRIPNSSYKILGYIPDISGHGNHGVIHNSAYGEGSGVNEDGSYQFDGVDDFVTIPTVTGGGKQVLMKVNNNTINSMLYDQRSSYASPNSLSSDFAIYTTNTVDNNLIAYQSRLVGKTYIDGILNTNITCEDLLGVLHNITITCDIVVPNNGVVPNIGRGGVLKNLYSKVALYDFMLFNEISTDDKIKELNEYVGIEAKVEKMPYYWDAYGKTNLDVDRGIVPQLGIAKDYSFASFDNEMAWYLIPNDNYINVVSRNGYEITLKNLSTGVNGWRFQNSTVKGFISHDIPFRIKANKSIRVYWDMHSYKISTGAEFGEVISITNVSPNKDTYINLRHLTEEELAKLDTNKDRMYYLLWFDLSTIAVNEEVVIEMLPVEGGRNLWLNNYNFAYDKMSGFGGYEFDKFTNTSRWIETKRENGIEVIEKNDYSFTAKRVGTGEYFWDFKNNSIRTLDKELTVKAVSNNNVSIRWEFKYRTAEKPDIDSTIVLVKQAMTPNVPITVTLPYKTTEEQIELGVIEGSTYYLFYFDPTDIPVNREYTVEMLPLYPNGLVYDAVTDYSKNSNIPALDDFTAIMKRKWLKKTGASLIKGSKVYEGGNGNALLFEWDKAYNFVFYKRTDIIEGELPDNISFITPTNYNGNVITRGSEQDTNGICIAGDGNAGFANMVFYKLILYPKTIPLLQINFLKNLMQRDEIIDLNNKIFIQ